MWLSNLSPRHGSIVDWDVKPKQSKQAKRKSQVALLVRVIGL